MKISIITVCFNSAATINDTIKSVKNQHYHDLEYILIDGGSSDQSVDMILAAGDLISKFISEVDEGIYDAMNKGINLASGEVIGFINADDIYSSDRVLECIAKTFSDPNIDACYADLCYVKQTKTDSIIRYWKSSKFIPGSFEKGWCPPHPTFFVRRSIYKKYGLFNPSYQIAADFELMMRFLEVHKIKSKYIPNTFVHMRLGGTTNKSLPNIIKQNLEILRALRMHSSSSKPLYFLFLKLISRLRQFISKPLSDA